MNQTSSGAAVSMTKNAAPGTPPARRSLSGLFGGAGGGNAPAQVAAVPVPRTVDLASLALIVTVAGMLARSLALLGGTAELGAYELKLHNKTKNPSPWHAADVDQAVHAVRSTAFISTALLAVVVALLVVSLRKIRSAGGSRWALLVVYVLMGVPLLIVPGSGYPAAVQVTSVFAGAASIVAILLLFFPIPSRQYFRACRAALSPPAVDGAPAPRPGLAGLFAARRPAANTASSSPTAASSTRRGATVGRTVAGSGAPDDRPANRTRAKVRSDADSVAKGAELARSRAKASKSRRAD